MKTSAVVRYNKAKGGKAKSHNYFNKTYKVGSK